MVNLIEKNIFDVEYLNGIAHCCNCFHTFGSGIALEIKKRFPEAYEVDKATPCGDLGKLGTVSYAYAKGMYIFNIYGQYAYGSGKRFVNYEHIYNGLQETSNIILGYYLDVFSKTSRFELGIPYKMASDRAGGSWNVISAMIDDIFLKERLINVTICKLP